MSDAQKIAHILLVKRLEAVEERFTLLQTVLDKVIKESNSLEKEREILGDAIGEYEKHILR
jgi:hypothetical protein